MMCQVQGQELHMCYLTKLLQLLHEISYPDPILQVRKLKVRELQWLGKDQQICNNTSGIRPDSESKVKISPMPYIFPGNISQGSF